MWVRCTFVSARLNLRELQPVPYEPCRGRPDSQPARPRLRPGCGSRTRSSPSAGAPPPLRTLGLKDDNIKTRVFSVKSTEDSTEREEQSLTSTLVDGP